MRENEQRRLCPLKHPSFENQNDTDKQKSIEPHKIYFLYLDII